MDIEFIGGKKVTVSTPYHVYEALEYFGATLKGNMLNPATSQFFTITNKEKGIDYEKKERYHSIISKIFWVVKRSRPDLETAVYFLCTRVQCPTEEDWGEIRRVLNYMQATKMTRG